MATDLLLSLVFLAVGLVFRVRAKSKNKPINLPPSPPKLPIIGNLHQFGFHPHRSLRHLSNKYGPLMLVHQCGIPTLVVSSAEIAEEIMKTHDLIFASRPLSHAGKRLFYDGKNILFSSYGNYWKEVRKISMLELLSSKRVSSFQLVMEEEVGAMIELVSRSCPTSSVVDLRHVLQSLFSSIISRISLGKKYGGEGERELLEIMEEIGGLMGSVCVGDYFPWLAWMDVLRGLDGKLKRVARAMDAFLDRVIKDHETDGSDGKESRDFVDVLLQLLKDSELSIQFTRENLKAIILDIFVAATETTTMTMEWAMAELVKHPDVMEKAQAEVRRLIINKQRVQVMDLHRLHYLKYIIKETLRLHPPGPLLVPHESSKDAVVQGYQIPSETRVLINTWAIARDPNSWTNPEEFLPKRFVNSPVDFKGQDFHFIPFGAGRRMCPGIPLATLVMEFALANLLYCFDWVLPNGASAKDLDMSEAVGVVSPKNIPLYLIPVSQKHN